MIQETGNTHPEPPSHMLVLITHIWGPKYLLFLPEQPPISRTVDPVIWPVSEHRTQWYSLQLTLQGHDQGLAGFSVIRSLSVLVDLWWKCSENPTPGAAARSHSPLQCRLCGLAIWSLRWTLTWTHAWLSYHMFQTTTSNSSTQGCTSRDVLCGSMGDRDAALRVTLHNGDRQHAAPVFAYSLQELLPDFRQSDSFTWPWPDHGALSPPVTGHRPAPAKLHQPCFQPGLWSKPGFRVPLTSARAICPVPLIYVWLQILQNLNFKLTQETSFNWIFSVVPAMKPKILHWTQMYMCEF